MRAQWDSFVRSSKNGTFLFCRDYMEYHSDRFTDCSYLFTNESGKITALFPASLHGNEVRSHGGLTYGGLVMSNTTSAAGYNSPLTMLPMLINELKSQGISRLIYKPVPHIYHRQPADEDLYALFRLNARLVVRNLASVISLNNPIKSSRLGKRAVKRAATFGITVEPTDCAADFWQIIVDDRRVRHNTTPVHTGAELQLLRDRFPNDIRFYIARQGNTILAGAVIYICNNVLHLQYAAATEAGKECYAVDAIYHHLIFDEFTEATYFDFGTSNEDAGRYLNEGMVHHKEEFGARSVIYDSYQIDF
jgi:hypothetical protein